MNMNATGSQLESLSDQNTILLTSYRRDGTPVDTPVHVAVEGNRAYVRSFDRAWKVKRIQRNPQVEIAPSTFRGRPTGASIVARARLLEGGEAQRAANALARKYPIVHRWVIPWLHRWRGYKTVHLELTPREPSAGQP